MKSIFCLVISLIILISIPVQSNQKLDSLYSIWEDKSLTDSTRVMSFGRYINFGFLYTDSDSAMTLSNKMLAYSDSINFDNGKSSALNLIGNIHFNRSSYAKALEYFEKVLSLRKQSASNMELSSIFNNIGNVYNTLEEFDKAIDYYKKSLAIYRKEKNWQGVAGLLNNIGVLYNKQGKQKEAIPYYQESLEISEKNENKKGMARTYNSLGLYYGELKDYKQSNEYYRKSLEYNRLFDDLHGISNSLSNYGSSFNFLEKYNQAIKFCEEGLEYAAKFGSIELQRNACNCIYEGYKGLGNKSKALEYFEKQVSLEDSLKLDEMVKNIQKMEFEKQIYTDSLEQEKQKLAIQLEHEAQINDENQKRNLAIAAGIILLVIVLALYFRNRNIRKSRDLIAIEKDRSEKLLLNILPAEIAEELKEKGSSEARDIEMVTIIFTDFKGFTQASEKLTAKELVAEINTCFKHFDTICEKYNIEKIKTIGDAYMAAGGLPKPTPTSTKDTVFAALEMSEFIIEREKLLSAEGKIPFEMRVGIHTGPVVAGIVGIKKFQYDIWGDTVNTASRMESAGEVGKVNVSQSTYELLKDDTNFILASRGKIEAKGKGEIEMFFVESTDK